MAACASDRSSCVLFLEDLQDVLVLNNVVQANALRVVLGARALEQRKGARKGGSGLTGLRQKARSCQAARAAPKAYPNEGGLEVVDERAVQKLTLMEKRKGNEKKIKAAGTKQPGAA